MSKISCQRVDSYNPAAVLHAVETQFEQLSLASLLKPGMRVAIKPNLLMKRSPEEFTTTHPAVVGAIIDCLKRLGITDIVIADSPGGPYSKPLLNSIYQTCGYTELAQKHGVRLNDQTGYSEVRREENHLCKSFYLIDPVVQADFVIDVCKLKTHGMVGLSGAVKNLFGCIPGLMKPELHFRFPEERHFCEMLVDLCETVRPSVVFVDAIDAMEGDGPSSGSLRHTGMLLAGTNPYDIDLLLCKIIGMDPQSILTVSVSLRRGLVSAYSADDLVVLGDPVALVSDFIKPLSHGVDFSNSMPKWVPRGLVKRFAPHPKVVRKGCVGCGKCAQNCPAHTIEIISGKAHIDYSRCIKCYCCHEMCPVRTIIIKRSRFYRI